MGQFGTICGHLSKAPLAILGLVHDILLASVGPYCFNYDG